MQRSAYFERALKGPFQEGRDKTITLMFDDEEALEDMQLLVRLAYQLTYSHGLRTVDKYQTLRMLVLANGYEMMTCALAVTGNVAAGKFGNRVSSHHEALDVFKAIPESLLEREELSNLVKKAGSMLAEELGFVESFFTPGASTADAWQDIFLLDGDIKSYSLITLDAVLQSKDLRMHSENSTFTLAF